MGSSPYTSDADGLIAELEALAPGTYTLTETEAPSGYVLLTQPVVITVAAADITPAADGDITFSGLEPGYYLITSTNGTLAMVETTPGTAEVEVHEKNPDPTLLKQVLENSTSAYVTESSAQVGDTVPFRLTVKLPKGSRNVKIRDTMDPGLTYTPGSVAIGGLTQGTHYTVDEAPGTGETFVITLAGSYLDSLTAETTLTVTYTAAANATAVAADGVDGENTARLTWGDAGSVESKTKTRTYQFSIHKYPDEDTTAHLAGAVFNLTRGSGTDNISFVKSGDGLTYRVAMAGETAPPGTTLTEDITTVGTQNVTILGLDLEEYRLTEKEAPDGYNSLHAPVIISAANLASSVSYEAMIRNRSGLELPVTGGMGTVLIYAAGTLLAVGAGAALILRRSRKGG